MGASSNVPMKLVTVVVQEAHAVVLALEADREVALHHHAVVAQARADRRAAVHPQRNAQRSVHAARVAAVLALEEDALEPIRHQIVLHLQRKDATVLLTARDLLLHNFPLTFQCLM
ncbi:hypothetical protein L5515_014320 [Caenorhabditis briggsae]|uniref:Uncharacterized protein n=1 Tax=Caenorhabditis briggsae TaxID=6238 RepID=A0AAE9EBS7_CAEBR|nr:hypothetical protein L5515_014320 [Caenorhabditis briggsae]